MDGRTFLSDYYASAAGPVDYPTGPTGGDNRTLRGGGWYDGAVFTRAAYSSSSRPLLRSNMGGFRCVVGVQ